MILVTTGTNAPAFDRLIRQVDELQVAEPLVVQHGPSALRPQGATCLEYVSFDEFVQLVKDARVVITHGGVGSILVTLMNGKRPVVMPRLARYGEHVDDHQVELSRRLAQIGVVELVEDRRDLERALRTNGANSGSAADTTTSLVFDLRQYLRSVLNGR